MGTGKLGTMHMQEVQQCESGFALDGVPEAKRGMVPMRTAASETKSGHPCW